MRILFADDDEEILSCFSELLQEAGYTVTPAATGTEALRLLRNESFDIALLDWVMPEPDGLALCRAMRGRLSQDYVYTILMSGRCGCDDVLAGLRAGADDYLRKPVSPQELLLRVNVAKRILSLGSRHVAVFMMAKLAESRDSDTGQHLERMRHYSWMLAKRLAPEFPEVTPEFIDNIYHTSPLHDIGKVGIPDSILLKPGRLSDEEFEAMKAHTTMGGETLSAAVRQYPETSYFTMARDIALTHHENYDGSGYPQGMRGDEIPLSGRIVAVADVYDALTSRRPYKRAFDHCEAKGIMLQRQRHFDPLVLAAFLEAEQRFIAVRETMGDAEPTPFALPRVG
jgi:putative two-component system response regulator